MNDMEDQEITRLLQKWRDGEEEAFNELIHQVYQQLHEIAHNHLEKEFRSSGLQTTELLNEVYLKLLGKQNVNWENRRHFYNIAAQAMYRLLIDEARKRGAQRHGGELLKTCLKDEHGFRKTDPAKLLLIDEALKTVEKTDPEMVQIVKMRFFAGYTIRETVDILGIPIIQVNRKWSFAKAWLQDILDKK